MPSLFFFFFFFFFSLILSGIFSPIVIIRPFAAISSCYSDPLKGLWQAGSCNLGTTTILLSYHFLWSTIAHSIYLSTGRAIVQLKAKGKFFKRCELDGIVTRNGCVIGLELDVALWLASVVALVPDCREVNRVAVTDGPALTCFETTQARIMVRIRYYTTHRGLWECM